MDDDSDARRRFDLAFRNGSLPIILNAAKKLSLVSLDDALRILEVMAEKHDERYGRAAARWLARAIAEHDLDLLEVQRAVTLLAELLQEPKAVNVLRREYTRGPATRDPHRRRSTPKLC
jgi:hypothetical protein